jgi:hypothetical protein
MMKLQSRYPTVKIFEDVLVGRENQLNRKVSDAFQRLEIIVQGIAILKGVKADVGCDLWKNVVP